MPRIVCDGDETQGHAPWPKATLLSTTQGTVFIGDKKIIVVGDTTSNGKHPTCGDPQGTPPCSKFPNHTVNTIAGSPNIFINGLAVVRDGDPLGCGDIADTDAVTVFANGGGNQTAIQPGSTADPEETIGYTVIDITDSYSIILEGNFSERDEDCDDIRDRRETFRGWLPTAFTPRPSNGFVITLEEENSGRTFESLAGQGAPNIPQEASEIFRNPLDQFVSYRVNSGPFQVDNQGLLTFTGAAPERTGDCNLKLRRFIKGEVEVFFSRETAVISKKIGVTASVRLNEIPS